MADKDRIPQLYNNSRKNKDKMVSPAERIVSHSDRTSERPPKISKALPSGSDRNYSAPLAELDDASPSPVRQSRHQLAHSSSMARVSARKEFLKATHTGREEYYTNPENIPPSNVSYSRFRSMYPKFMDTRLADDIRKAEYDHLEASGHVCFDYSGFGLFSHRLQELNPSSSSFSLAYVTGNLATHALYGAADEGTVEGCIRRRILEYLNISDADYSMVFTASRGTAFKLLAESYPFHGSDRLLTAYDHDSESVKWMAETAKRQGAKVISARFKWPSLRICSTDLKKQMQERRKKKDAAKGLFVFPVQSRVSGAKYSYQWMSHAQNNNWHVLLDATALGPKDMGSLGLSLFRPDFIIASFYKIFGADPTGFGCLFIKNSAIHCLNTSSRARGVGMVRIVPTVSPSLSENRGSRGEQEQKTSSRADDEEDGISLPSPGGIPAFSGPVASFYATAKSGSLFLEGSNRFTGDDGEFAWYQLQSRGNVYSTSNGSYSGAYGDGKLESSLKPYSSELGDSGGPLSSGSIFQSGDQHTQQFNPRKPYVQEGLTSGNHQEAWSPVDERESPVYTDEARAIMESEVGYDLSFSRDVIESQLMSVEGYKLESAASFTFDSPLASLGQAGENIENGTVMSDMGGESSPIDESLKSVDKEDIVEREGTTKSLSVLDEEDSEVFQSSKDQMNGNYDTSIRVGSPSKEETLSRFFRTQLEFDGVGHSGSLLSRETERGYELYGSREVDGSNNNRMLTALSKELDFAAASDAETSEQADDGYSRRQKQNQQSRKSYEDEDSFYTEDEDEARYPHEEDEGVDTWDPILLCTALDHADAVGLTKTNMRLRFLTNWLVYSLLQLRHPGSQGGIPLVHIYGPKVKFDRGQAVAFNICDWSGKLLQPGLVQRLADRSNIGLGLGILHNMNFPVGSGEIPGLLAKKNKGRSSDGEEENACIPLVTASVGFLTNFEDVYRLWHFVAKFLDVDFVAREVWRYHSLNQETVVMGSEDEPLPKSD